MPYPALVVLEGDSRIDQQHDRVGLTDVHYARSFAFWASYLSGGSFAVPASLNFGRGGDTTAQVLDDGLANVKASAAKLVIMLCSTNDRFGSDKLSANQTITNLDAIKRELLDAGKGVLFLTELPRKPEDTVDMEAHMAVANWLRGQANGVSIFTCDAWSSVSDPMSGQYSGVCFDDGLHPTTFGHFKVGETLAPIIRALMPEPRPMIAAKEDVYSARNPSGSHLQNGFLTGIDGAGAAALYRGNVPSDWTFSSIDGGSIFARLNNAWGNKYAKNLRLKGASSAAKPSFYLTSPLSVEGLAQGMQVEARAEICLVKTTGLRGVALELMVTDSEGTKKMQVGERSSYLGDFLPAGPLNGIIRTAPITIVGTALSASIGLRIFSETDAFVDAEINIGRIDVRNL